MQPDRRLDEFAARQYGVFSLDQAKSVGLSTSMVETRIKNGAWIRLAPGVYSMSSAPPRWERQMAAAVLTRSGSIVAGPSAAFLHGLDGFNPGRPVIMIGPSGNARSQIARVIRCESFSEIRRTRVKGFEAEHPVESVVTLSRGLGAARLERLVDDGLVARSFSPEELFEAIERRGASPGVARLRPIAATRLPDAYEPPVSELERLLHAVLDDSRIPSSQRQIPFDFPAVRMTVDVFIPAWRLIVEADGRRWHSRLEDFERDRRRDNAATAHGYGVLRFTYQMLKGQPGECLETLLQTGRTRSAS